MKNYLFPFLVVSMMTLTLLSHAQVLHTSSTSTSEIEELSIFPNPTKSDKLYITSKRNLPKTIEIYDVLGNQIFVTTLLGKSINISRLATGLYILKIKEGNQSATRKLVVR